ncbi:MULTISPECIES: hypothetical protein [Bacillus cereus group]|uniref:hypothetical protein n=1 Tax=Bacillus TaxID=1386 RepID=UPI000BEBAC61|nr:MULTISPECIES: hypothetical protein [Bacillus cereus group]MDA2233471.1 hypothetical protein [Bacillus cereus]MEB9440019.1 hypothetical protein [Bacillus cereus]PEF92893.1 hypothetical protein CON46_13165 [Bacillus cereus]PFQ23991.1 hypothetical protein COK16_21960 [Bacillus cereus]PGA03596.1 hypothetical protein COL71_28945 [Bacillus mycoides]
MANRDEKFGNKLSALFKEYPLEFLLKLCIPIFLFAGGGGIWLNERFNDSKVTENESLKKENESLKRENEKLKKEYDIDGNMIYETANPLKENQSITVLKGKVTILIHDIRPDAVTFEFSYEGKSNLEMDERWKEGSKIHRIPFEHEGKSYFIVVNEINDEGVSFSVHLKE